MGLLHKTLNVLNMDGTLQSLKYKLSVPYRWVDLQVPHSSLYCERKTLFELSHFLQPLPNGITLIGNGNYHYVSYLLLSKIKEDFTLILFDHHTDMMKLETTELISCGSWVANALDTYSRLKKVIIVGSDQEADESLQKYQSRFKLIRLDRATESEILKEIQTQTVYISIDKDVLCMSDAVTNWDQGQMNLDDLLKLVQSIVRKKQVVGVDVCGEMPVSPVKQFQSGYREARRKNERSNLRILRTLLAS